MPNSSDPFDKSNYLSGSTATVPVVEPPKLQIGAEEELPIGADPFKSKTVVAHNRYGTGKPRRVVIRGTVTRE